MKNLTRRSLSILIGAGVLLIFVMLAGYYLYHADIDMQGGGTHYSVVLSKGGFQPQVVTIKKGDTVTFSTDLGIQYWPASNQHPIHADYPSFDPKHPLNPGEEWSFTFDRVGTWGYHDHLNSPIRGTIIVTE